MVSPNKAKKSRTLLITKKSKREYPLQEFLDTEEHYLGKPRFVQAVARGLISERDLSRTPCGIRVKLPNICEELKL